MKRITMILVALGATWMLSAGGAAAKPDSVSTEQLAKQQCRAQKAADKAAFETLYGKHAMRTCVKGEKDAVEAEQSNAAQQCRAERTEDPAAFAETYGNNENGKNAFGKCVSSKVKEAVAAEVEAFTNAAKECRAERAADSETFKATYGTNENGKNAFGKCVSSKVKEAEQTSPEA